MKVTRILKSKNLNQGKYQQLEAQAERLGKIRSMTTNVTFFIIQRQRRQQVTRFEESRLVFEFGERWHIFKLDEHRDYQERIGKIDETKAVDFVGIWDERIVLY